MMLQEELENILVCPVCKAEIEFDEYRIKCKKCLRDFIIKDSIPILIDNRTRISEFIDKMKIKNEYEVKETLRKFRFTDKGFLNNKILFIFSILTGVSFLFKLHFIFYPLFVILIADYITFFLRRREILNEYNRGKPRLETSADFDAVNKLYAGHNARQPSMEDWEKMWGLTRAKQWKVDLHYLVVADVYDRHKNNVEKIVDIGTGDGRLCYNYGIGQDRLFYGIDVSLDLLRRFNEKNKGRNFAILADGIQIPLRSYSVDFIVCSEVLEHLSNPEKAIREFERILRSGKYIIVQSPNAARIRNLNPFHIVGCVLGLFIPSVLQRKIVHENTWITAYTYHWDFTRQDIKKYIKGTQLEIIDFYGAYYFLNPRGSLIEKFLYALFRYMPILNQLGGDLVVVLRKT